MKEVRPFQLFPFYPFQLNAGQEEVVDEDVEYAQSCPSTNFLFPNDLVRERNHSFCPHNLHHQSYYTRINARFPSPEPPPNHCRPSPGTPHPFSQHGYRQVPREEKASEEEAVRSGLPEQQRQAHGHDKSNGNFHRVATRRQGAAAAHFCECK